jgi:hypothetical protein
LIDNDLSSVGKISELSLPETERVWIGLRVSKLITEHSKFREMRIRGDK